MIDAVGDGVDPGRVGQRVWLFLAAAGRRWGTAAEWTVVPGPPGRPAARQASSWSWAPASASRPMTAHRCVFADGPVAGKTVLVAGGAGAVGHFAIELAKHGGARVITTVSGPQKAELAAQAGADLVVNYRDPDAADQIRALAAPVDHVVELALGANLQLDLAVIRPPEGLIVVYAADPPTRCCRSGPA